MKPRHLLLPSRVRTIERPFGWIPCRLLQDGFLKKMSTASQKLYFLLSITSDRRGISFYGEERIVETILIGKDDLHQAQKELTQLDLLAFDEETYQLLSLPYGHPITQQNQNVPQEKEKSGFSEDQDGTIPDEARQILHRLLGVKFP